MENIISTLLKDREENECFNIEDEEFEKWKNRLEDNKKELEELALEHLEEKYQARFSHLTMEIEEIERNIFEMKKQKYYEVGAKDGAELFETLKNR